MQLTIIVPAHNEEKRLAKMLDEYLPFFSQIYHTDFEMLVVINGSSDQTVNIAEQYALKFAQMRSIVEPKQIGKGGAIMLGFAQASGDLIGFVDADGSTPAALFQDLVLRIGQADAIIASRWLKSSKVSPRQSWSRRMASRFFNGIVRLFFGLNFSDTQCGAKLIKQNAVREILPNLGITRWAFDVDLLFQLHRAGFQIIEIPSTWHDVAGSRLKFTRASLEMFVALVRLRLLYSPFKGIVAFYDRYFARFFNV
ncbi:MAG: glycosyltransferase family 2 protein [Kiritimatiellia bacterium]|nr:glycosyltransferase family 2 protein [Kiritimatiellia bacterium]